MPLVEAYVHDCQVEYCIVFLFPAWNLALQSVHSIQDLGSLFLLCYQVGTCN